MEPCDKSVSNASAKMPNGIFIVLILSPCILNFAYFVQTQSDPGPQLFLTPLIKSGEIEKARIESKVGPLPLSSGLPERESYSGYITVNEEYGSNMFFWFFPAIVSYYFFVKFISKLLYLIHNIPYIGMNRAHACIRRTHVQGAYFSGARLRQWIRRRVLWSDTFWIV